IHVPNIFEDSRFVYHDWWHEHELLSLYAVPVVHDQQLLAVLTLYGREPFSFDAEDHDLLEIFVAQIATAFRNASLFEAVAQTNRALETSVARANDMADHQRVKQIITNLLTNGVKYNRAGGSVTITFTAQAGYLRIAVRDTGVGIEPDKIGRLFDPFDRLDAEISGIEGTGLGLTISR